VLNTLRCCLYNTNKFYEFQAETTSPFKLTFPFVVKILKGFDIRYWSNGVDANVRELCTRIFCGSEAIEVKVYI